MAWWWPDDLPADPVATHRSCLVRGNPRGGTWLLCGLLAGTGLAGRPHEWFWHDAERHYRRRWGIATFDEYLRSVLAAGTGANGVFGAKLMWAQLPRLLARLRTPGVRASDRELLERALPEPRYVRVVRRDVVAQAASFDRAIRTGHWHHWDPPAAEVD